MSQQRKRIWIEPFQTSLFYRVGLYWLVYQLTVWNFLFAWQLIEEGPGDLGEQLGRFVQHQYPVLLCFVLVVPILAFDAVRFAHRLVGPLVRFRRTMQAVTEGTPVRPIKLREGDYLTDMQDDFNAMLHSLQERGGVVLESPAASDAEAVAPASR